MSEKRSRSRSASPKRKSESKSNKSSSSSESEEYTNDVMLDSEKYAIFVWITYDNDETPQVFYIPKGALTRREYNMLLDWSSSEDYMVDYLSDEPEVLPMKNKKLEGQPETLQELHEHRLLQDRFVNNFFKHCGNCSCEHKRFELANSRSNSWYNNGPTFIIRLFTEYKPYPKRDEE